MAETSYHLLIDTTVDGATIGLSRYSDGHLIGYENFPSQHHNSSALNTLLAKVLDAHAIDLDQVDNVVVGRGPGSFTGIKVGLAFAYGLRHKETGARSIIGYSPLEQLCALDPEGRNWILGATRDRGAIARKTPDGRVELCDFNLKTDYTLAHEGALLVKPWPELESVIELGEGACEISDLEQFHYASMQAAALVGLRSLDEGGADLPLPLYLRKSTAEEKLDGQKR